MPDIIPSLLANYVSNGLTSTSLTLLTSVLNTPSNWLITRFLYAVLNDHNHSATARSIQDRRIDRNASVVFISLVKPLDLWIELGRKIGIDITNLIKAKRLYYVDGLPLSGSSNNVLPTTTQPLTVPLDSFSTKSVLTAFTKVIKEVNSKAPNNPSTASKPFVVIDGLDFLIASQPENDAVQLQHLVSTIRTHAEAVMITANADSPLLHNRNYAAMPLEIQHSAFVTSLAHQSSWIMQCRGLDTGTAKDVTGVLRISRGGTYNEDEEIANRLVDDEWLYQLKGDGSVRVWSRGQG